MPLLDLNVSTLLIVDVQTRLMPAIHEGAEVITNIRRLIAGANLLAVPQLFTEQNARGLGASVPGLLPPTARVVPKMTFDSTRAPDFLPALGARSQIVVAGCEAHVCVLQTVLGLLGLGRKVAVVRDAIGARRPESHQAALARMAAHGANILTTEMVLFEWLASAEHPRFREVVGLIK